MEYTGMQVFGKHAQCLQIQETPISHNAGRQAFLFFPIFWQNSCFSYFSGKFLFFGHFAFKFSILLVFLLLFHVKTLLKNF